MDHIYLVDMFEDYLSRKKEEWRRIIRNWEVDRKTYKIRNRKNTEKLRNWQRSWDNWKFRNWIETEKFTEKLRIFLTEKSEKNIRHQTEKKNVNNTVPISCELFTNPNLTFSPYHIITYSHRKIITIFNSSFLVSLATQFKL